MASLSVKQLLAFLHIPKKNAAKILQVSFASMIFFLILFLITPVCCHCFLHFDSYRFPSAAGKPNATVKCVKLSNGSTAFELPIQVLDCFLTLNEIQLNVSIINSNPLWL